MKLTKDQMTARPLANTQVGIRYLGQEGFLFSCNGKFLATDLF